MQGKYSLAFRDSQKANPNNDSPNHAYLAAASAQYFQADFRGALLTYQQAAAVLPYAHYKHSQLEEQHYQLIIAVNKVSG